MPHQMYHCKYHHTPPTVHFRTTQSNKTTRAQVVMGNVIGNLNTIENPFWNSHMSGVILKSGQMLVTIKAQPQAVRTTYIFLYRHQPQHKCPLQANWRTWRHAQSSLASFTFHSSTMSSRDESIRATAWCNRRAQWVIPASQTGCPCFKSLATLEIDSYPDGSCKWNGPFTRGGQLLTLRERGSSPLAWLDEYKLTYSPSPPSSFALSLYEKKGGTQTQAWGSWEGHKAFGNRQSVIMWLKRRAWLAEVWYYRVSYVFSTSLSAGPPGGTGVCYFYKYQHILATWTCSASYSTGIL